MRNTKKHILIIADPIDKQFAGIHFYTRNLITHFSKFKSDYKISIIKLKEEKISKDISHYTLPNSIPLLRTDPIRTFYTLPKLIQRINPDIVIEPAHFGPFNLPKHIKRITVIHDLTPLKFPKFHPYLSVLAHRLLFPTVIKNADLLLTNSQNTLNDLLEYSPSVTHKSHYIHLGKADLFKPSTSKSVIHGYKIQQPYFLSIGTIEPRKNLICLLEAYRLFRTSYKKKVNLIITGEFGWKSTNFYKKYLKHPFKEDIKLLGYVKRSDLPSLYTHSEAFIYPSFYEGFGLPVLEALACGTASIISNSSSLTEVGGNAALYFNPHSPLDLKEQMIKICEQEQLKTLLKEKSINQAKKFSWDIFTQHFFELIDKELS